MSILFRKLPQFRPFKWLMQDEFTTNLAAGSVNGTPAEPGPGNRVVVDTGNHLSIAGGQLVFDAAGATGDPGIWYPVVTRLPGVAFSARVMLNTNANALARFGFDSNQSGSTDRSHFYFSTGAELYFRIATSGGALLPVYTFAVWYQLVIILRSSGSFALMKGGIYTDWSLVWVESSEVASPLYPVAMDYNRAANVDYVRMAQLNPPWNSDYGIATQILSGARSAGDAFVHRADCHIEFVCTTLPAAGTIIVKFRIQDAANYWQITIDSTGALELDEVVGGGVTSRGTSAAAVVNGNRVVIITYGTNIAVHSVLVQKILYAAASNFQTMEAGELNSLGVGGAVSTIITWPRYPSLVI